MSNLVNLQSIKDIKNEVEQNHSTTSAMVNLELIKLNPNNKFGMRDIEKLSKSLVEHGQLHNIVIRKIDDEEYAYEMISGERRLRAAKLANWTQLKAEIIECDDIQAQILQIVANLETRTITHMEESENAMELIKLIKEQRKQGLHTGVKTRDVVASMMSKDGNSVSSSHVAKLMTIDNLIEEFKSMVRNKELPLEKAVQLAQMTEEHQKLAFAMGEDLKKLTSKETKELKKQLSEMEIEQKDSEKLLTEVTDKLQNTKEEMKKLQEETNKQIKDLKSSHDEEVKDYEKDIKETKAELKKTVIELENRKKEAEEKTEKIRKELEKQLKEKTTKESQAKIEELTKALDEAVQKQADIAKEDAQQVKDMQEQIKALEKESSDLIDEYEKEIKKLKTQQKDKMINQQNIELNIELLALTKQTSNMLKTLFEKVSDSKNKEGFELNDEVKKALADIGKLSPSK